MDDPTMTTVVSPDDVVHADVLCAYADKGHAFEEAPCLGLAGECSGSRCERVERVALALRVTL